MRLWHEDLIPLLPRFQLLGQHREICALRGLSWDKKHSVVDYVFKHPYYYLYAYHRLVICEMEKRGYHVDMAWKDPSYRGQRIGYDTSCFTCEETIVHSPIYPEHDDKYLQECLLNLKKKGIQLSSQ